MAFGIGLYAPSLVTLSLMGLDPKAAFPIMMGACAFLMPVTGLRFVADKRVDLRIVLGLALGGAPAVLVAAYAVTKSAAGRTALGRGGRGPLHSRRPAARRGKAGAGRYSRGADRGVMDETNTFSGRCWR